MLNLDTHILLHALEGSLKPAEQRLIEADTWSISSIVIWEVAKLAQLGRLAIGLDDPDLARALSRLHIWPITVDICREIVRLDIQGDPADELIAATSVVHSIPLVTRDRTVRRSRLVPIAR